MHLFTWHTKQKKVNYLHVLQKKVTTDVRKIAEQHTHHCNLCAKLLRFNFCNNMSATYDMQRVRIFVCVLALLLTYVHTAKYQNVDKIIVVVMENWSFDGLFGMLEGVNGMHHV